jgi:predicted ATP-binding protein involved in virulence
VWSINQPQNSSFLANAGNLDDLEEATFKICHKWQRNPQENIPLIAYYPVSRAVFNFSLEIPKSYQLTQLDAYNQALDQVQIGFEDFFQWFRVLEDLENEERRDLSGYRDHRLEAVRRAVPQFLDGFSNLRVRRSQGLRMTVEKQGQELVINQLSDGEKCLLAMVGDIARRLAIANPGLEDPLQGEGVVLIDEIELHLHPQWQRKIIPALTQTFPNCQFIVTTHSPQVISHVEPESIYILEATSEGIKAFRPEYSLGRDSNTILEDLMGVSSRPEKQQKDLQELFRLIEEGNLDAAREKAAKLSAEIGSDEAELVGARAAIRRKEILGR